MDSHQENTPSAPERGENQNLSDQPTPFTPEGAEQFTGHLTGKLWRLVTLTRRLEAMKRREAHRADRLEEQPGDPTGERHVGRRAGYRHDRRASGARGQGRVLRLLSLRSPIPQKELVYLLGIRSQSLAEQIGKLEADGLVERHPNPEDRRTSLIELTDAGKEAVERAREAEKPSDDPFNVLNDEEQAQLAGLLDRVIAGLEGQLPERPHGGRRGGGHGGHGGHGNRRRGARSRGGHSGGHSGGRGCKQAREYSRHACGRRDHTRRDHSCHDRFRHERTWRERTRHEYGRSQRHGSGRVYLLTFK